MKRILFISVLFCSVLGIEAKKFKIINNSGISLKIFWKSNGLQHEVRSGDFVLGTGKSAQGETFRENCIHFLSAQSLDGFYRAKIKPFCYDARVDITLVEAKTFFTKKPIKKLVITVKQLEVGDIIESL